MKNVRMICNIEISLKGYNVKEYNQNNGYP